MPLRSSVGTKNRCLNLICSLISSKSRSSPYLSESQQASSIRASPWTVDRFSLRSHTIGISSPCSKTRRKTRRPSRSVRDVRRRGSTLDAVFSVLRTWNICSGKKAGSVKVSPGNAVLARQGHFHQSLHLLCGSDPHLSPI